MDVVDLLNVRALHALGGLDPSLLPEDPQPADHDLVRQPGPASELARLGLRPCAHLRLVPEQRPAERKRMAGALAGTVSAEAVEALIRGLDEAKAERVAQYSEAASQG
ncbi:hypothetical protein [Pseudonocardia asaccharolytica]|uniref:Uncharacterized protein n=1 Tax=Pseudonocardia asaccharolytica DSM 44247 = NBRC 16224 TaxID=1123024 RepID=A0A511D0Y7_9PSEU|nr:hypothetical protein [Pseudonocardia asaccharolytica]GEL18357.1 hypothetical protein PA7_21940 [Pseudonocardia asaccharolytica DSM 44247 = NBRC 16224]